MSSTTDDVDPKYTPFDNAVKGYQGLLSIARHDTLQQKAIEEIVRWREVIAAWKREAVEARDESRANYCLGLECLCMFFDAELNMWLLLKDRKPEEAWAKLVEAQNAIANVIRAHKIFSEWQIHVGRLLQIEEVVFPKPRFVSAGLRVRRQLCSICHEEYEDCPHLVGIPYWGEFCWRILSDFTPDHIAFVEKPANKRCRVTYAYLPEGKRNQMTWEIEPYTTEEIERIAKDPSPSEGRNYASSIMHVDDLKV